MSFLNRLFGKKPGISSSPQVQLTFRKRLIALGNLPKLFKLVWKTSPSMTVTNIFLRVIRSAIPLALLYTGKLIIDQIVMISQGKGGSSVYLWKLVAIEFGLAIFSDGLGRAITLFDSILGDLFS